MTTKPRQSTTPQKSAVTRPSASPQSSCQLAARSRKANSAAAPATTPAALKDSAASSPVSKKSQLLALLRSSSGATMEKMIEATGWQAHSIRGCISAIFRKKMGLTVEHLTLDTARVYRITA